jgi:hypothetical protein
VGVISSHIFQAFNAAAQRDSKVQVQIGEEAKRGASAIKAMALVAITFLPATFVSVSLPVAMYRPSCVHVWLTEPLHRRSLGPISSRSSLEETLDRLVLDTRRFLFR